jgi:hypothetical protein
MATTALQQFRARLYSTLPQRADATMDLLDALCSNTFARSVTELSLVPAFRRGWCSVLDAIDAFFSPKVLYHEEAERAELEQRLRRVVAPLVPPPEPDLPGWVFSVDALPMSRPHARKLYDRGYVHQADPVPGRPPVTIGHEYSLAMALPPRVPGSPPWVVPLSARRVPWQHSAAAVAGRQVAAIANDASLPWHGELCVFALDSNYSVSPFLGAAERCETAVAVTRLRSNRVLYHPPAPRQLGQRGRPRVYGAPFRLSWPATWGEPDETDIIEVVRGGRRLTITLKAWHNKLLTGDDRGRQVHRVTVVRAEARDEAGQQVYDRPLWLAVTGARRGELTARQAYAVYGRRFDQEHSHRFMRQRLLFDAFRTCETEHEENWVTLVTLAYAQLYAARDVVDDLPRPWERQSAVGASAEGLSPTRVQRGFGGILAVLGTPARAPQRRGKSPGRVAGAAPGRRIDRPLTKRRREAA